MQERLIIEELMDFEPLKVPTDFSRDIKKLTKFLTEVQEKFNKLLRGVQRFNKVTARELMARPSYTEAFESIRGNISPGNTGNRETESGMES